MTRVRLGAVGYLNARPLVYGLEQSTRFDVRFDLPARCAELLHGGAIDVGLIPSIEYLRGPLAPGSAGGRYAIVPDLAIASRGPVASVALYTSRPIGEVRSIALDTSSRTSVALVRVLCARVFRISPALEHQTPDIAAMLSRSDAALIIGDAALLLDATEAAARAALPAVEKIDLGSTWTGHTGLPFVYAFWAGMPGALMPDDAAELQEARSLGVTKSAEIAGAYFESRAEQAIGAAYLRDNIKYSLGAEEQSALEHFYRYAAEIGVVEQARELRFYR
jgi:chorismate dehydratase